MSQSASDLTDRDLAGAGQNRRYGLHGIKALFFDLDNTLIDTVSASRAAIAEVIRILQYEYHYTEREADMVCERFQAKLSKECFDPSKISITNLRIQHWEGAIQEVKGGTANQKLARECYFLWKTTRLEHLTLTKETRKILRGLKKVAPLLLLTNGDTETQREKIEACACQEFFDAIVVGGEQKEEKPSPSIFLHCCELLGVQAEDCVMIGDSLDTDIQGGLNAGLKATIWINKTGIVPKETSPIPHYTISSLLDLPGLLVQ
ncbi:PREDICTED: N-acylneuraminate-9-phosphatase [Thamnophis sirtalis]|uniref:N-acylneuraminate-9-phosphatase n=1 Tax=Thamnophis sirtalis TaxID=35019 RepID=A0A6I9Z8E7_9SAUR|nr:PREDICTED: N-acylneuraminate-9-phosphatase [Thamnophis sirtalis]